MPVTRDQWWRAFVDNVPDYAFILLDADNRVMEWNAGAQRILGYSAGEVIGQSGALFFTPEDRDARAPEQEVATALKDGRAADERWHMRKDGSRFRASGVLSVVRSDSENIIGFAKVMRDVTESERNRELLERTLRERTALLSEIHHRIKNNLQTIVSVIALERSRVADPDVGAHFDDTQNRVRAIAAIHERIYSTEDFATVHLGSYLKDLVRDLESFYGQQDRIRVEASFADVALDSNDAIPVALISNELLCNAFKYAFPDGRRGNLSIGLEYHDGGCPGLGVLEVADDGVGLPAGAWSETPKSMGFHLIRILAQQLRGRVELPPATVGTRVRLTFPITGE